MNNKSDDMLEPGGSAEESNVPQAEAKAAAADGAGAIAPRSAGHADGSAAGGQAQAVKPPRKALGPRLLPVFLILALALVACGAYAGAFFPEAWYVDLVRAIARALADMLAEQLLRSLQYLQQLRQLLNF